MSETLVEFWKWVIIVSLSAYFGLSIVIAIGGYFDVRKMFRRLNEMHRDDVERPAVIARAREGINVSPVPPARDENNNDGTDPE